MQKDVGIIGKQDQMEEFTGINNAINIHGEAYNYWTPWL